MDNAVYELGRAQYLTAIGYDDLQKDDEGFVLLRPTADHVDKKVATLTTDIDTLEEKLKQFRAKKAEAVKYQKSSEYKESKKKGKRKKEKKARATLLEMVFNNADANAEAETDNEDDENYKDAKKKTPRKKNTLDTTYGTRFSPVVSMLYDSIKDFEQIATEIREELDSAQGRTKGMYRSSQIGNLIAATKNKFDVVKELGDVAKIVSDLEYKKEKDKKAAEGADTSKVIANIGAQFLRGGLDESKGSKGKKGKKERSESNFKKSARKQGYDPDDDDDDRGKDADVADNVALAKELAKSLSANKRDIRFTPHERHMDLEGKYTFVVACDPLDPEHTWEFVAVDDKGKKIKGFKENYKELYPKKKSCRMRFDTSKKKCTDLNSSRTYKLIFT